MQDDEFKPSVTGPEPAGGFLLSGRGENENRGDAASGAEGNASTGQGLRRPTRLRPLPLRQGTAEAPQDGGTGRRRAGLSAGHSLSDHGADSAAGRLRRDRAAGSCQGFRRFLGPGEKGMGSGLAQSGGVGTGTEDHREEMRFLVSTFRNLVSMPIN